MEEGALDGEGWIGEVRREREGSPVGSGRDELGDGVRQRAVGRDVEDGERILAVVETARGEDDGDEVDAGIVEERGRARFGEELNRGVRSRR